MSAFAYLDPADLAAIRACLLGWRRQHAACGALALLPEAEAVRLPEVQRIFRDCGVPLAGGIFPALVRDQAFDDQGLWLLRLDLMPAFGLVPNLDVPAEQAAAAIARALGPALGDERETLFLLFDAMLPHIASVLDELYLRLADQVRYAGVNAGSETFQPRPCVFDNERVLGNAALWLLLPGEHGAVLEHGYQAPEHMLVASSTDGNRIAGIDWRPAFDVYQERMREEYGVVLTHENFYRFASHFPFGIPRADGQVVVRIPVALKEDGSLFCIGEIPPNAMLCLLQAPAAGSQDTAERVAEGLGERFGDMTGRDLLAFYCAGRRMHLGEAAAAELRSLFQHTGAGCMAGALSLGEIGSRHEWGYPLFHNATVLCHPWGGK